MMLTRGQAGQHTGRLPTPARPSWGTAGRTPAAVRLSVMSLSSPLASEPSCERRATALYSRGGVGVEGPGKGPISGLRKGQGVQVWAAALPPASGSLQRSHSLRTPPLP